MLKLSQPITSINGFKIGDKVRLKDGDGRPHIIKSFFIDGMKEFFFEVQFEDGTETWLDNIAPIPSNLDEAAQEYFLKTYGINNIAISEDIKKAVKFGAEWIVGQGVTEVSRLYRDPNPPHEGLFFGVLPFFSTIQMALNYQDGEEVIVQIRKKQ